MAIRFDELELFPGDSCVVWVKVYEQWLKHRIVWLISPYNEVRSETHPVFVVARFYKAPGYEASGAGDWQWVLDHKPGPTDPLYPHKENQRKRFDMFELALLLSTAEWEPPQEDSNADPV